MNSACMEPNGSCSKTPTQKTSKMILPVKNVREGMSSREHPSRWKSQSVLQWMESLAIATEKTDGKGALVVGRTTLSEATVPKSPEQQQPNRRERPIEIESGNLQNQCRWNLSSIEQQDPLAWIYLRIIRNRVSQAEELIHATKGRPNHGCSDRLSGACIAAEQRLIFTFQQLVKQHSCSPLLQYEMDSGVASPDYNNGEIRSLLDGLYEETIQKLDSWIAKLRKSQLGERAQGSATNEPPLQKQELAAYMTNWLFQNWINPYPDDEGLKEMANHCGTTTQVISNWLINARTRKWRPALQQACNMGRPSEYFMEDSLNIFKGEKLRQLSPRDSTEANHPVNTFSISTPSSQCPDNNRLTNSPVFNDRAQFMGRNGPRRPPMSPAASYDKHTIDPFQGYVPPRSFEDDPLHDIEPMPLTHHHSGDDDDCSAFSSCEGDALFYETDLFVDTARSNKRTKW